MTDVSGQPRHIVWIASYPKSGNTWVRFLVCNLVFGAQESAAALNRLVPDIHELAAPPVPPAAPAATLFLKTHFPCSPVLPLAAHTAAALYVVRHPADVMVSSFHYSRRSMAGAAAGAQSQPSAETPGGLARYVEQFLAARGDPRWISLRMGSWDEHVRSWLAVRHPFPVLPLRYEDLLTDARGAARRICSFLGLARSETQLEEAVAGASFQRLREIEEADIRGQRVGIFYKPYLQQSIQAGLRFMRAGRVGEAGEALSVDQRRRTQAIFAPLLRELGYDSAACAAPLPDVRAV